MLSGRYMTDYHTRHWSRSNVNGYCQLCLAALHSNDMVNISSSVPPLGTLEQQLLECPSLSVPRERCKILWRRYCDDKPELKRMIGINTNDDIIPTMQFLLDPSCCPDVICATQEFGLGVLSHIQYLTRTWCYSHHIRRNKLLKLLNII